MRNTRRSAPGRGLIAAIAVLVVGLATSTTADTITFNPLGTGGAGADVVTGINSFNFGFGSAVIVGAATIADGQTYQVLYQTELTSYNGTSAVINDPRLNAAGGYQVTEVASFFEVAHINPATGAIIFTPAPGQPSSVTIYDQSLVGLAGPTYDLAAGTGFGDGNPIYSSTLAGDASTFQPTGTAAGFGQIFITAGGSGSPAFFVTPVALTTFQGAVVAPYFIGSPPPVVNGHPVGSADLSLQYSGGVETFVAVPEPTSLALGLMAIAIAPLVFRQVRCRRARA